MDRDEDELVQGVREVVAESLACELEKVKPGSNLMEDLGAESLDYLDIVFRLEQRFDLQLSRGELERAARGSLTDEEFAPSGVIAEVGLARLRELLPEAGERIRPGLRPAQILGLFSVQTFVNIVRGKREGRSA